MTVPSRKNRMMQNIIQNQERGKAKLKSKETEEKIKELSQSLPKWMRNRKKDYLTGKDIHLIGTDLDLSQREDIKRQKIIKSYRGVRHSAGLPVRGQRTRTSFRKGATVGVVRKKALKKEKEGKKGNR